MSEKELKEKLDRLKASRGAHRGVITKRIGEANTILEPEGTLNNEQAKQLDVLHRLLESKLKLVESLDESILSLCEVETIQAEIEDSERVLERVVACQKSIQDALTKRNNESSAQESQINPSQGSPGVAQQAEAKLPKLILPRFRGDVTKWTSFCDSYKTAVHESKAISTIDKFNYLNSLLEGPASRSIQGLSLTEANYNSAIEILHERFGKTQQIISAHMEELLKLPSCSTLERSNSLRFVYDKISVHIRGLSSLGVASDQYGGLLIPVVMSKLPNEIRVRIARETTSAVWKIEELMDVIKREVEAIEVSENVKITDDRNQKRPPAPPPKPRLPTAGTFFGATSKPEANVPKCVYCSGRHYSASCDKVTDINARRDILRRDKRCFMCLKRGHLVEHCDKSCRICKRRHHQSICQEKSPRDPPNSYTPTEEQGFSNRNNEEASGLGSATTTATSSTKGTKGSILLQTATAIATSEDGSKSIPVRILFDNGSQRSYVTDHIKARLGLTATSTETLHLNTFGENAYRKQKCQVFTLPLRSSKDEFVEISALNFPVICSPLPKRIDVTKYPHLTDLDLADSPANEHDSIDILIGSDYYWDIVTGESIRGEFGPTAINSKFGWLLSGPTGEQHVHANSNVVSNLVISGEPVLNEANQVDEITNLLKQFWETESIGIKGDLNSANHSPIEAKRNEEISFDGRHYEVSLPWKEDCLPRTNNYRMCETLHHKLKGEPNLLHEYDKIIQEQARTEIVERVPKLNDANKLNTKGIYYSPHHAVVRKDRETTKVRIVYDGSAKNLWIKSVQATSFAKEIEFLKRKDQKSTPPTYVTQFGLYIQEGIVKCKGRMNNANLPGSTRNPILLPAKHEFVQLIIKKGHESVKHCGLRDTLTTLRERFWILRGREAVKRVIKKCVICLRINGMPYKAQSTPDLPSERVSDDPPFTHVGLDFAGPLNIVNEHANESSKVYVCLFTCASTRAVHLELCKSLDVQDFLLAFRRFASRRGLPATINSDNAKTFKSSSKEIRRITRSNEVLRYLVNQRVTWNFIVEKAPWWGGFWERLVRSVKLPLKKVLGRSSLSFEQLRTLMVEIESVINARPITYVYDDANSISYPLSPSDLVYGRRVTLTPNDAHYEIVSTHQSLTRRAKHHKNLLQQVTKQWRKEYLTSLREQSSPRNKGISVQEISVGDIVLLKNDSTNRIHWKIARVEELIPGADGKVRAAIVKVGNSDKRPSYLRRVIQHLIPIEVKSSTNNVDTRHVADVSSQLADAARPRRTAAVIGEIGRRQMNIV